MSLRVVGHRSDRYHEIQTLLQSVSLGDLLDVTLLDTPVREVSFRGRSGDGSWETKLRDLADEALEALGWSERGIRAIIDKRIPVSAGLGGSSADAAGLLRALCLFSNRSDPLVALAPQYGSDVPGMLMGGRTLCVGRGEEVMPQACDKTLWFSLLVPPVSCDTRLMYEGLSHPHEREISSGELRTNDFERLAKDLHPEIRKAFEAMESIGGSEVSLTGSGSGVFCSSVSREKAAALLEQACRKTGFSGFVFRSMDQGYELISDEWGVAKR